MPARRVPPGRRSLRLQTVTMCLVNSLLLRLMNILPFCPTGEKFTAILSSGTGRCLRTLFPRLMHARSWTCGACCLKRVSLLATSSPFRTIPTRLGDLPLPVIRLMAMSIPRTIGRCAMLSSLWWRCSRSRGIRNAVWDMGQRMRNVVLSNSCRIVKKGRRQAVFFPRPWCEMV